MKIFMFFINAILWLSLFIIPAGILGFIGLWYFVESSKNLILSIVLWIAGGGLGIVFAEIVRRKYGLDNFFGRRLATPDIDGGNILDEKYGEPIVKKNANDKKIDKNP
ncbi:MAG: hypothetical protein KGM16_05260 [Bacteroidota bacterium]|nr:hypothetical protein [Bacteroidota bacterium]